MLFLSGEISLQLLEFAIFGHTAVGRHWCLNIFLPINFFFFHPDCRAGAGVLLTLQQSSCIEMIWQRCGHDIFAEFGSCMKQELWNAWGEMPSSNGVWYFHLSLGHLQSFQLQISSSLRLWVWLVPQEQAGAGQGDGHVLWVGNEKGLQALSKAKGRSYLKCSSTTLPNNLAWLTLNKSVIYAWETCSST